MPQAQSKPLSMQARADLFNSLAAMDKAGLPVDKALALLHLPGTGQTRLEKLRKSVSRGADIASAGEKSGLFTSLEAAVIHAALCAGSPAATYRRLADDYAHRARQLRLVKSRLSLPLLVFILALLLHPLPGLFDGSLSGGGYLLRVLRPLILSAGVFYLVLRLMRGLEQTPPTPAQTWAARRLIGVPVFGPMLVRRDNRDFFASLALLLESGIAMFDALPLAAETIGNGVIRADFSRIKQYMTQRATLAAAVEKLTYVANRRVTGYIRTGEAGGTLPEMLRRFTQAESEDIAQFQRQVAAWLPRVVYGMVLAWMAYTVLTGSAFMPPAPQG
jgi:general secretion pathway protein F